MARRRAGKADPKSASPRDGARRGKARTAPVDAAPADAAPASGATLTNRLAALEHECAALRAELQRERSRRQALEEVHAATRDRIAWALNSLQAILDARS